MRYVLLPRGRSASCSPEACGRPVGAGRAAHVRAPEVGREPALRVREVGQLQQLGGAQALLRLRVQARLRARAAASLSGTGVPASAARTPVGTTGRAHKPGMTLTACARQHERAGRPAQRTAARLEELQQRQVELWEAHFQRLQLVRGRHAHALRHSRPGQQHAGPCEACRGTFQP